MLNYAFILLLAEYSLSDETGAQGNIKDKPGPFSIIESGKVKITAKETSFRTRHCYVLRCLHLLTARAPCSNRGHCPGAHRSQ